MTSEYSQPDLLTSDDNAFTPCINMFLKNTFEQRLHFTRCKWGERLVCWLQSQLVIS